MGARMALRVCPVVGCPTLVRSGKCDEHRQSTAQRGYGLEHQREREQWAPIVAQGKTPCRRCREVIKPDEPWDLGHPDADCDYPKAPEHRRHNRATATHAASV